MCEGGESKGGNCGCGDGGEVVWKVRWFDCGGGGEGDESGMIWWWWW